MAPHGRDGVLEQRPVEATSEGIASFAMEALVGPSCSGAWRLRAAQIGVNGLLF